MSLRIKEIERDLRDTGSLPKLPTYKRSSVSVTADMIKQREELQKSVLKHSNRLIDQLVKNLDEADNVVKKRLSTSHLERLINYLRDDITPLRDLINRVSLHAETLGSLKSEYELRGESKNDFEIDFVNSTAQSKSSSRFTKPSAAQEAVVTSSNIHSKSSAETPSPPYFTPHKAIEKLNMSSRTRSSQYPNHRSTSPARYTSDIVRTVHQNDSSDHEDSLPIDVDRVSFTHAVDLFKQAVSSNTRRLLTKLINFILRWKIRVTGSRDIGIIDVIIMLLISAAMYRILNEVNSYSGQIYRSLTGVRRGVIPM